MAELTNIIYAEPPVADIRAAVNAMGDIDMDLRMSDAVLANYCYANSDDVLLPVVNILKYLSNQLRAVKARVDALMEQADFRINVMETSMFIKECVSRGE